MRPTTLTGAARAAARGAEALAGPWPRYALAPAADERRGLARAWLALGVAALVGSGLFSLLLVLARTPGIGRLLPGADFFHVALVVHVDLSVLVWFAAFAGMLWTAAGGARWLPLARTAFACTAVGLAAMVVAPFLDPGRPVMANYVPVIESVTFLAGLGTFALGGALLVVRAIASPGPIGAALTPEGALRFGLLLAAVSAAIAVAALGGSLAGVPHDLSGKPYYEMLFWGPGHVLQFTWTLLLLVAWLWLAGASGAAVPMSPRLAALMFAIAFAPVLATPAIYAAWNVAEPEHQRMFTWLMRFGGGLAIPAVALAVIVGVARAPRAGAADRPLRAALGASIALFSIGGLIGFLIQGSDVRVPAHYHGAIVGITLALMGATYAVLPQLGYAAPDSKLARWQPWIYGAGQFLHIVGLVWSGGYGVQRKVAGAAQVLRTPQEVMGMGLMGFGGLVAIVGGLLFVVVVIRALRRR
jgi:hypothetical protein